MYINALNNLLVLNLSHVKKYNVQNFTYRSHQPPHLPPSGFSNWNEKKKKLLFWVRRGARYPNLQIVITHALYVYSQHLFGLHSE